MTMYCLVGQVYKQKLTIKGREDSLIQHLLSTYYMPGTVLSSGDTKMKTKGGKPRVSNEKDAYLGESSIQQMYKEGQAQRMTWAPTQVHTQPATSVNEGDMESERRKGQHRVFLGQRHVGIST